MKLTEILTRKDKDVKKTKITRMVNKLKRQTDSVIDNITEEIENSEEELDKLLDLIPEDEITNNLMEEIINTKTNLKVLRTKLEIAKEIRNEYF